MKCEVCGEDFEPDITLEPVCWACLDDRERGTRKADMQNEIDNDDRALYEH